MFPLFVVNGVLGIRDTGSPLDSLLHYRRAVASGAVLGPRVLGSGPLLDGPGAQWPTFTVPVTSAAEGRHAVDSLAAAGVDFIKVYDRLPRDAFLAIADEAKQRHVPVIGHVPFAVGVLEASAAGMRSIEHFTLGPACIPRLLELWRDTLRAVAAYDESACRAAGSALARNGTWLVPTLSRERTWSHAYLASRAAGADPALRYVPQAVRAKWDRWRDSVVTTGSARDDTTQAAVYRTFVRIVRALRGAGVGVLAGTDTDGNDAYYYGVPGYTLHAELETLVRDAGFTPAEALRAATLDAARFLGASDSVGTVANRKVADLVLLDANPLIDIRNAGRIAAVVANGRYLDRSELERLLSARH
jgi:imidazolonepropionase-like amidohydrolase